MQTKRGLLAVSADVVCLDRTAAAMPLCLGAAGDCGFMPRSKVQRMLSMHLYVCTGWRSTITINALHAPHFAYEGLCQAEVLWAAFVELASRKEFAHLAVCRVLFTHWKDLA